MHRIEQKQLDAWKAEVTRMCRNGRFEQLDRDLEDVSHGLSTWAVNIDAVGQGEWPDVYRYLRDHEDVIEGEIEVSIALETGEMWVWSTIGEPITDDDILEAL